MMYPDETPQVELAGRNSQLRDTSDLEAMLNRVRTLIETASHAATEVSGFLSRAGRSGPPLNDPAAVCGDRPKQTGHIPEISDALDSLENRLGRLADYARLLNQVG